VGPRFNPPINFTFIALDFTTTYTKVSPAQKNSKTSVGSGCWVVCTHEQPKVGPVSASSALRGRELILSFISFAIPSPVLSAIPMRKYVRREESRIGGLIAAFDRRCALTCPQQVADGSIDFVYTNPAIYGCLEWEYGLSSLVTRKRCQPFSPLADSYCL